MRTKTDQLTFESQGDRMLCSQSTLIKFRLVKNPESEMMKTHCQNAMDDG